MVTTPAVGTAIRTDASRQDLTTADIQQWNWFIGIGIGIAVLPTMGTRAWTALVLRHRRQASTARQTPRTS